MRPGVRRARGFTLLESLVAGGIFFVAVVAISLIAVRGATNASRGLRYAQTARVATQEMESWSMRGYAGLQTATGGATPWSPAAYRVSEQPDAGGKQYDVTITVVDTTGPPLGPPGALPPPQLGTGGTAIPSYFINVQVTSTPNAEGGNPITVSQSTYVSPN